MKTFDLFRISLRMIKSRFLESFMVVLGLAVGVGVVASVLGIVLSFQGQMDESGDMLFQREIRVTSLKESYEWNAVVWRTGKVGVDPAVLVFEDLERAMSVSPAVQYGYTQNWWWLSCEDVYSGTVDGEELDPVLFSSYDESGIQGQAVSIDFLEASRFVALEGELFTQGDIDAANPVALISSGIAAGLPDHISPLDIIFKFNGTEFRVIGVYDDGTESSYDNYNLPLLIPYTTHDIIEQAWFSEEFDDSELTFYKQESIELLFAVDDAAHVDEAREQLAAYFRHQYGDEGVKIQSYSDFFSEDEDAQSGTTSLILIFLFIAGSGLIIASINIMNLMLARVLRRNRQTGVSIAIGAGKRDVFALFLTESMLLGAMGGILGCGLSFLLKSLLEMIVNGNSGGGESFISLTWGTFGIALGVTLLITSIFSVYPAYKASKLQASEVIRVS